MLFNSTEFILYFLPASVVLYYGLANAVSHRSARWGLILASLFFYSYTLPWHVLLLTASLLFNYNAGLWIERLEGEAKKLCLILAISANLILIAYFKYADFLVQSLSTVLGFNAVILSIGLPLAISFFTFQQIAYIVNAYRGNSLNPSLSEYLAFVTFFPHLIAGPLVQHSDLIPQLRDPSTYRFDINKIALGVSIFLLGLAKKVVLADHFGVYSDTFYNGVDAGSNPSFWESWFGILSYALQLYFDFSGYSDMAIGLGIMFGIVMPQNFNSPYKSTSIIDFWTRWHMTLSRFLREFVYIPLGGNRRGNARRHANLMATMLLGGLWHGASWNFVIWGGLHGLFLIVNHSWRQLTSPRWAMPSMVAGGVTFICVVLAWVPFRAASLDATGDVLLGAMGQHGFFLPAEIVKKLEGLALLGDPVGKLPLISDGTNLGFLSVAVSLLVGLTFVWFMPNIQGMRQRTRWFIVVLSFALVVQKVFFSSAISSFLYFRF